MIVNHCTEFARQTIISIKHQDYIADFWQRRASDLRAVEHQSKQSAPQSASKQHDAA